MISPLNRTCPGCGLHLPVSEAAPDSRYHATPECWQLYGELSAYTLTRGDKEFIHQLAVDTYAAQHVGGSERPIGVAFALIGLYFACERGYSGRQVQHLHSLLAQRSKSWPRFVSPGQIGSMTVLDIVQAPPGVERDAMLRRWGQAVWEAWDQEHHHIQALVTSVLA